MYSPGLGLDLHAVADVDEQRHLDRRAGLDRRGLVAAAGGRVAAQAGLGLGDLELDRGRAAEIDDGWPSMKSTSTSSFGLVQRSVSASGARGHRHLLVGLGVHEVRVGAVGVQELHLARLGAHGAELLAGAEGLVDDVAVAMRAAASCARTPPPLPGLTCWNSTTLKIVPSTSMWLPFLSWLVLIKLMALLADGTERRRAAGATPNGRRPRVTGAVRRRGRPAGCRLPGSVCTTRGRAAARQVRGGDRQLRLGKRQHARHVTQRP